MYRAREKEHGFISPDRRTEKVSETMAQLIQQVWEVDPLVCPLCSSPMRIISFIQDDDVIEKILKHTLQHTLTGIRRPSAFGLNLWEEEDNKAPPEVKEQISYEPIEDELAFNF